MKIKNPGKVTLGTLAAGTGTAGTIYMITDLSKSETREDEQAQKDDAANLLKQLEEAKAEAQTLKEENERAKDLAETIKQGSAKTIKELEGTITSLTEENARVNGELAKAEERIEETEELYISAADSMLRMKEFYRSQSEDYVRIIKENGRLRSTLRKHEERNPLIPRVGCWISPDDYSNPTRYSLNCPGTHIWNDGKEVGAVIVTFARKQEEPELFEAYKRYFEVTGTNEIKGV